MVDFKPVLMGGDGVQIYGQDDDEAINPIYADENGKLKVIISESVGMGSYLYDFNTPTNTANINEAGQLSVIFVNQTPSGKTEVSQGGIVNINKDGGTNTFNWVIPNGETFVLTEFDIGGYVTKAEKSLQANSKLYYQPNGTTVDEVLLSNLYIQGQSEAIRTILKTFVGDGTARFQIRSTNWSGEPIEFSRFIRGYY